MIIRVTHYVEATNENHLVALFQNNEFWYCCICIFLKQTVEKSFIV